MKQLHDIMWVVPYNYNIVQCMDTPFLKMGGAALEIGRAVVPGDQRGLRRSANVDLRSKQERQRRSTDGTSDKVC